MLYNKYNRHVDCLTCCKKPGCEPADSGLCRRKRNSFCFRCTCAEQSRESEGDAYISEYTYVTRPTCTHAVYIQTTRTPK